MLDSLMIEGLTTGLLAAKYDNPKPVPDLHRVMWEDCCSDARKVALAAPRGHAKSTAITHAYVLGEVLFRTSEFVLLVSDTEGQAAEFLGDIKAELEGNETLQAAFGVKKLLKSTETNVIALCEDGHMFRIQAKGSEQKVRGLKWRGKRPDLIVGDDLENDEIVLNPERREKFRKWFMNALLPCGSDTCRVRIVGTILHLDSMLNRLLEDKTWKTRRFEAHNEDFSEILWREQFPKERLIDIRDGYKAQGDLDGYAQEYLNRPIAEGNTYFNKDQFIDFDRDDNGRPLQRLRAREGLPPSLIYYAAADFAISEKEKADYTVIMVAGMDSEGFLHVVDVRKFRGDSEEIIDELISVQKAWNPVVFTFETEKIDKALGPFLEKKQRETGAYMNIVKKTPTKSKTARGKSIQAMMKAKSVKFDKEADWYPALENELLTISNSGPRGSHDDMFDAFAYIGLTIDEYFEAMTDQEYEEEEYEEEYRISFNYGANEVTGY